MISPKITYFWSNSLTNEGWPTNNGGRAPKNTKKVSLNNNALQYRAY